MPGKRPRGRRPQRGPHLVKIHRKEHVGKVWTFKSRIFAAMHEHGLTVQGLADHLGVSKPTASRLLDQDEIDEETARRVCEFARLDLDELLA